MKRLFKKKVSLFGKEISVFVVVLLAVGLVGAALIPFYGIITGMVTVEQGLTWDGADWDDTTLKFDFNEEVTTSLDGETFTSSHYLENTAGVDTEFTLDTDCDGEEEGCDEGTPEGINWYYEYLLDNSAETMVGANCGGYPDEGWRERCEKRIVLNVPMLLDDLDTISWNANVIEGYAPHVDVILDNGESLTFEYAKVDPSDCDDSADYPVGEIDTFDDKGIIDDSAYAWESISGPCGDSTFDAQHKSLADWKSVYPTANIVRIDLEIDNWISASDSDVSSILINGNSVEASGLIAGSKLYFDFLVEFPKMLVPDKYTITTTVNTA